jgi:hypothetical protein
MSAAPIDLAHLLFKHLPKQLINHATKWLQVLGSAAALAGKE